MSSKKKPNNKNNKAKTTATATVKSNKLFWVSLVLGICAVIVIATGFLSNGEAGDWARGLFAPDGKVQTGKLTGEGIDEIDSIPEGEVRFYINKNVVFKNTYSQGSFVFQNPELSEYCLRFKVYVVNESGNSSLVYTSDLIEPGQYLSGDKLDSRLLDGTYDCTYTALAYLPDDPNTVVGETSGYLTIIVEE